MQLRIKNLYGRFNYRISFMPSGITILTGPNGFGKSTILRCLEALCESNMEFFAGLPFDEMEFSRDTGETVTLKKKDQTLWINEHPYPYQFIPIPKSPYSKKRYLQPKISLTGQSPYKEQDLQSMAQMIGVIKMIREQRLIKDVRPDSSSSETRRAESKRTNAVDAIPYELARIIAQTANQYSEVATKLDSSFPYRVLENQNENYFDKESFDKSYEEMNEKLKVLASNGISEITGYQKLEFKKSDARVLKIFFDDFNKKYKVYEPLMKKLSLYQDIINRRFKFKCVQLSESRDFMVIDEKTKKEIPLSKLSSGEQEILVLFYDLIFNMEKDTLILLDEPETSLHIEWQMMFIDDLKRITELNHVSSIIATHSADIIGGNRDIQIDLGELYQNGLYSTNSEECARSW